MTCEYVNKNIKTEANIIYSHSATEKKVKDFMKEQSDFRESNFNISVITTIILAALSAIVIGLACFNKDKIFPYWMTNSEISLLVIGAIIILILTKLAIDYILRADAPYFPICPEIIYYRELSDKEIIETSITVGKANEFASILFIAEDKDHCITYKRIEFEQVIFKTDINEVQIDINENKVYIPYDIPNNKEKEENDKKD